MTGLIRVSHLCIKRLTRKEGARSVTGINAG